MELKKQQVHGICNSDIDDVWAKTAFGHKLFSAFIGELGKMSESEAME